LPEHRTVRCRVTPRFLALAFVVRADPRRSLTQRIEYRGGYHFRRAGEVGDLQLRGIPYRAPIETIGVFDQRRVATLAQVGDDRANDLRNVLGGVALAGAKAREPRREIRRGAIECRNGLRHRHGR
jgi:hypothetical protein